jgi:hypothetical protein
MPHVRNGLVAKAVRQRIAYENRVEQLQGWKNYVPTEDDDFNVSDKIHIAEQEIEVLKKALRI